MTDTDPLFESNEHALITGALLGYLDSLGVQVSPVFQGNDFAPSLRLFVPGHDQAVTITVEPPPSRN